MVAAALAKALRAGVKLDFSRDAGRPIFRCSKRLEELLHPLMAPEQKAELHALLRHAAGYRAALREFFRLAAAGPGASPQECRRFLNEEARLADELGLLLASVIRRGVAREWWTESGLCPWCGELGEYHEVQASEREVR